LLCAIVNSHKTKIEIDVLFDLQRMYCLTNDFNLSAQYVAMSYWVINNPGHCRGAAVDLFYFSADPNGMTLEIPSAGVSLKRL
jgi:hypothetical protein